MKSSRALFLVSAVAVSVPAVAVAQSQTSGVVVPAKPKAKLSKAAQRGQYIVTTSGCHSCHTPFAKGPQGPAPDMTRELSGHPEGTQLPPPPVPNGPWILAASATNTAWAGPWGISYGINLTPDKETGIGSWTEQQFIQAIRTGKHMGQGRPILPPMPWKHMAQMTDADLKAVFAYLKALPPIKNKVPEPTPPAGGAPGGAGGAPAGGTGSAPAGAGAPQGGAPAGGPKK